MRVKFRQICSDKENLYGLDKNGNVWRLDGDDIPVWIPLPMYANGDSLQHSSAVALKTKKERMEEDD